MEAEPRTDIPGERIQRTPAPEAEPPPVSPLENEGPGDVENLVDALGMAWATYCLYPDPREQTAWLKALELLRSVESYPMHADVGASTFVTDQGEIEGTRDGVARLVRRLFVHDVSAVVVGAPPQDADLLSLFSALDRDVDEVRNLGGVRSQLINDGIEALQVVPRSMLSEADGGDTSEEARHSEVAGVVGLSDPGELAQLLLEESGRDVAKLVDTYGQTYERVFGLVAPEDLHGREDVVQVFVDAFFYLPDDFQIPLLESFIAKHERTPFEVILDQFSGHDLARLAGSLPEISQTGLMEYAEASAGQDSRPEDLLQLLQSAAEVKEARQAVAGRIGEMIGGDAEEFTGSAYNELREELAEDLDLGMGYEVLRQLLAVEDRDSRFRRLLRVWSGKVSRSLRDQDLDMAASWLEAVLKEPVYPEGRQHEVDQALRDMATPELIGGIVDLIDEDDPEPGRRMLDVWGQTAQELLIDRLAEEESAGFRHILIDLIARVAKDNPKPVIRQLNDKRWYVVRNLVMVLGKTRRPDVVPRLASLAASHSDHRVRVEALRALMPHEETKGVEAAIAGLRDRHERVRQAALALLAASEDVHVDRLLVAALSERRVAPEVKERIIGLLGDRDTPQARRALLRLSKQKALFGPKRSLAVAARDALAGAS